MDFSDDASPPCPMHSLRLHRLQAFSGPVLATERQMQLGPSRVVRAHGEGTTQTQEERGTSCPSWAPPCMHRQKNPRIFPLGLLSPPPPHPSLSTPPFWSPQMPPRLFQPSTLLSHNSFAASGQTQHPVSNSGQPKAYRDLTSKGFSCGAPREAGTFGLGCLPRIHFYRGWACRYRHSQDGGHL